MDAGLRGKRQRCPLPGHIVQNGHKCLMKIHMIPWNNPKGSVLRSCQYNLYYGDHYYNCYYLYLDKDVIF